MMVLCLALHLGNVKEIKAFSTYHFLVCTYQVAVLQVLWAAAGFQSMAMSTNSHDPAAVFIPGTGWVYSDPTFNENFSLIQHLYLYHQRKYLA